MDEKLNAKYIKLKEYLKDLKSVVVAYSSGVDSTFLLKAAKEVLKEKVIAATLSTEFFPERELKEASEFCKKEGIPQIIIETDILNIPEIRNNPKNRCYLCKKALFEKIIKTAADNNTDIVIEGSNVDDDKDYRPGKKAIEELGIKSPLKYAGLTKQNIRDLSKELNLITWNKPSIACLASRFVYGEEITRNKLKMVDRAEQLLYEMGFKQFRVRIHNTLARIEIMPEEFEKILKPEIRQEIVRNLKEYGFSYISMDLIGYRTGSMNETINK